MVTEVEIFFSKLLLFIENRKYLIKIYTFIRYIRTYGPRIHSVFLHIVSPIMIEGFVSFLGFEHNDFTNK